MAINSYTPVNNQNNFRGSRKDNLDIAQDLALRGAQNQSFAFRVHSENMANAETTSDKPGGDPYQRKIVDFKVSTDRATGMDMPEINKITKDKTPFRIVLDPSHPAADANGVVKLSNVESLAEMTGAMVAQENHQTLLRGYKMAVSMKNNELELMK